jgi:hypothetical protein
MINVCRCRYDADDYGHVAEGLYRNEARCDQDRAQERYKIEEVI